MKNFKLESGETSAATPHAPEPYRIKRLSNLRVLVHSHDTFGLGNIRRMLAICEHLRASIPGISILIVSGSPMVHSFRAVDGIDYIKLPCLRRNEEGNLGVRFLSLDLPEVAGLRRELILATVQSFQPAMPLEFGKAKAVRQTMPKTRPSVRIYGKRSTPTVSARSEFNLHSLKSADASRLESQEVELPRERVCKKWGPADIGCEKKC